MLYKEVHEHKQLKGRANDAVAAACLFISCRQEEVPRSFKEICAVSRHSKKEIGRCYKLIRLVTDQAAVPAASTSDFMVTLCSSNMQCLWIMLGFNNYHQSRFICDNLEHVVLCIVL